MNLAELKRYNKINIYKEILKGRNTINSIAKELNISSLTVSELTADMVKRGLLESHSPKRDKVGRRSYIYSPSHKYYSVFIDKQEDSFCVIGITTNGKVVVRFDVCVDHEGHSPQKVFDDFVLSKIRCSPIFNYCMSIYLSGINIDEI